MTARTTDIVTAAQVRLRLDRLLDELAAARRTPLRSNAIYMADLQADIVACRASYVAAAVFELAILHGIAHGRSQG